MVSAKDLTKPATIEWMSSYESAMLKRFGYSEERAAAQARLCPAFSLPGPVRSGTVAAAGPARHGVEPEAHAGEVSGLLDAIPPYFSQDVITPDRRTATLAFGIRLMSLAEQQQLIEAMRSSLHPPAGVSAQLVGLPVLAAQSGDAGGRPVATPGDAADRAGGGRAGAAVAFRGDRRRALVPLVPIALATGWSALVLFAVRVPLNPMSVTLGALVIAISTEFSVLLSERYRQERLRGNDAIEALRRSTAAPAPRSPPRA